MGLIETFCWIASSSCGPRAEASSGNNLLRRPQAPAGTLGLPEIHASSRPKTFQNAAIRPNLALHCRFCPQNPAQFDVNVHQLARQFACVLFVFTHIMASFVEKRILFFRAALQRDPRSGFLDGPEGQNQCGLGRMGLFPISTSGLS